MERGARALHDGHVLHGGQLFAESVKLVRAPHPTTPGSFLDGTPVANDPTVYPRFGTACRATPITFLFSVRASAVNPFQLCLPFGRQSTGFNMGIDWGGSEPVQNITRSVVLSPCPAPNSHTYGVTHTYTSLRIGTSLLVTVFELNRTDTTSIKNIGWAAPDAFVSGWAAFDSVVAPRAVFGYAGRLSTDLHRGLYAGARYLNPTSLFALPPTVQSIDYLYANSVPPGTGADLWSGAVDLRNVVSMRGVFRGCGSFNAALLN